MGSDYCQIASKLGVFLLGDMTARTQSTKNPQPKRHGQGKLKSLAKYFTFPPFLVVLYLATAQLSPFAPNSVIAIALGTTLHEKGAIFCSL